MTPKFVIATPANAGGSNPAVGLPRRPRLLAMTLFLRLRNRLKPVRPREAVRRNPPARSADRAPRSQVRLRPHPSALPAQWPADPLSQLERHRVRQAAVAIALQLHARTA